jgi:hypothetical protein
VPGCFNSRPAIAHFAFHRLVGQILVGEFDRGNAVHVIDDEQAKDRAVRQGHDFHHALVRRFGHEAGERREEPAVHDELHVAELTVGRLQMHRLFLNRRLFFGFRLEHQVNQDAAVRNLFHYVQLAFGGATDEGGTERRRRGEDGPRQPSRNRSHTIVGSEVYSGGWDYCWSELRNMGMLVCGSETQSRNKTHSSHAPQPNQIYSMHCAKTKHAQRHGRRLRRPEDVVVHQFPTRR